MKGNKIKKTTNIVTSIWFYVLFLLFHVCLVSQGSTQTDEYTLKAAFIERFTRFIEWPSDSMVDDVSQPFILGIIGEDSFVSVLERIYATQRIKNKKVIVKTISDIEEIATCHLLFITRSMKGKLTDVMMRTRGKPILTVSDSEEFTSQGVLINMYLTDNRIRFAISQEVFESPLSFSSMLLKVAKIEKPEP